MKNLATVLVILGVGSISSGALCDDNPVSALATKPVKDAILAIKPNKINAGTTPLPSWNVNLGFSRDYAASKNSSYYSIDFKGNKLTESGTAVTLPVAGLTAYAVPTLPADPQDINLKVTDGIGSLNGPLVDALALKSFDFLPELFKYVNGTIEVSGQPTAGGQVNTAVGLESKPIKLPFADLRIVKVLRLGVVGEKTSNQLADGGSQDLVEFTYRAYAGTGFGFVQSNRLTQLIKSAKAPFENPTIAQIESDIDSKKTDKPWGVAGFMYKKDENRKLVLDEKGDRILVHQHKVDGHEVIDDVTSDAQVKKILDDYGCIADIDREGKYPDQPTVVLEVSAEGAYAPVHFDVRRYTSLYTASVGVYLDPHNPDAGKLSVGYENGYNRGAPTKPLNGLFATLGFKF